MNVTKKITLALGLLAAGTSFAQTPASDTSFGLLGQRYGEINFAASNLEDFSDDTYSTGISFNEPVVKSLLDITGSYDYSWFRGPLGLRGHANTVFADATAYTALAGVKPFITGGIGYQWLSGPAGFSDKSGVWRAAAGVEIPIGAFTLTPRIAYDDDFDSGYGNWSYEVEGNYWFNARSAAVAKIGFDDLRNTGSDAWTYQVGYRFKF